MLANGLWLTVVTKAWSGKFDMIIINILQMKPFMSKCLPQMSDEWDLMQLGTYDVNTKFL